jgi:hypothetical protein
MLAVLNASVSHRRPLPLPLPLPLPPPQLPPHIQ